MKLWFIFFTICVLLICFLDAEIIDVCGEQSGVWESGNTYQITENVTVISGETLVIEPGTIVKFMSHDVLEVFGTIKAVGALEDSILFTYDLNNTQYDYWNHIETNGSQSSGSIFKHCIFEYASVDIWCFNNSNPLICNNRFSSNDNNDGILAFGSSPRIINNRFDGFYKAIYAEEPGAELLIRRNVITNSDVAGIYCNDIYSCVIEDNTIISGGHKGIYCCNCDAIIRNNVVRGTTNFGICCRYEGTKTVIDNLVNTGFIGVFFEETDEPRLINNTITNCKRALSMDDENETIEIVNNIFYDNYTAMSLHLPELYTFSNNLFWNNTELTDTDEIPELGIITSVNINYDPCDRYLDLFIDPLFEDPSLNYYTLSAISPAIDAGNCREEYLDPDGTIADMGAYYYPQAPNIPTASIDSDITFGAAELTIQFSSICSGDITGYLWDFGDDSTSTLENPHHTYSENGIYDVSLTVTGPGGSATCLEEEFITVTPVREVYGDQSGVWNSEYCYLVTDNINVNHNDTLYIEPGTVIRFMGLYHIHATGTIIAEGTETDSIRFTSGNRRPFPGDWENISYVTSEAAQGVFSHVSVEYADTGILLHYTALNITNSRFSNNYCGIDLREASPLINHNYFSYNYDHDINIREYSSGTICDNYFTKCFDSIRSYEDSSPLISNNIFENEFYHAISIYGGNPEISGNWFINNDWSIVLHDGDSIIHNNLFCGAGTYGIYDFGNDYGETFVYNNTFCNLEYAVIASHSAPISIMNNAFNGNEFAVYIYDTDAEVSYNQFFNNITDYGWEAPQWFGVLNENNYNNDPCDQNYNIFLAPEFDDPQIFNFNLTETSPCIDAGNPDPLYYDPNNTISDIGACYFEGFVDNDDNSLIQNSKFSIQNYPNPFNPNTTFEFNIPKTGTCTLNIYNLKGQLVKSLLSESLEAGYYQISWNGIDKYGKISASGIYFYRLKTDEQCITRQLLLLK